MAGDYTFGWARTYDADQLAAFIDDLWGAASGDNDLETLDAIEQVIAEHRPPLPDPAASSVLTPRQTEILTHFANGANYHEAGTALGLARNSVITVLQYIVDKLHARNRAHAVAIAAAQGWLPDLDIPEPDRSQVRRTGRKPGESYHQGMADQMRAHPGSTFNVGPYSTRHTARSTAAAIRGARFKPYAPARSFATDRPVRTADGTWAVPTRFVGAPTTTEPAEGDPS